MSDLIARTEEWLSGLLSEANKTQPADSEDRWAIRDKLALAKTITDFLAFKNKMGDPDPQKSTFGELKDKLK